MTLWLTGLSGAGKTTLAHMLAAEFRRRSLRVEVLDGDVIRETLSKGLGFSKEDRDTNIRRIGFVSNLLSRNGVIVIVAAISPYRAVRDEVRASHQASFIEVLVDCPLDVLMERDTKGLYRRALSGEISNLTGVCDPYEKPSNPEIVVRTDLNTPAVSAGQVFEWLETHGLVGSAKAAANSPS